ncbi:hypothetical protein V7S43_017446 [Phytophthora oleae]|uniref:GAF domain-containing protein n=1 Tax=Phytophthora oleae TaxID=2107226 RepID=A0ABD3ET11_9STRA
MSVPSSFSSPERREAPRSADDSDRDHLRTNNITPFTPSSSFFIIHESSRSVISPSGSSSSPPKLRRRDDPNSAHAEQRKKKSRSKTPLSAPVSSSSPTLRTSSLSPVVYEENEENGPQIEEQVVSDQSTAKKKRAMELSILNRCGSSPDLPRYSPLSASVYSSSKKRALQGSTNGASPHLATLQRSRLTPLPANTRPVVNPDPLLNVERVENDVDAVSLRSKDPLLQEKMQRDAQTISSLKQRLVGLEREISASTKYRRSTEKQTAQLSLENQRLQAEKTQQQIRIDELDKTVLRQRHEYDKLAARYTAVYANLQKLVDQQHDSSDTSAQQSALQALARENQDFLRKLRVLEARRTEDRTLTSNQEKKIKRLKAEIEALHHMHEAKTREEDFDEAASDTDQVSRLSKSKKSDSNHGGRPNSASSTVSITSSTPRRVGSSARMQVAQISIPGAASHLVAAEAYQYIDPNILKVLEKVDSQFSITNAINLSVVLKKWLNSCVHVVCSTHLPTVLQTLLKRMCELLHCEHAAVFTVDHAARKLVATCSERGVERWELPLDKGISGYAARHNTLCNVHCANDDPRFYSSTDSITGTPSREVLALPIVHELQLYLEAHLGGGDSKTNNLGVFAVLRAWNTTHQKPFSANDQILGSLLAIQAGIILRQTAVTKTLQKINHKTHQILQMPSEIVAKASTSHHVPSPEAPESPGSSIPLVVQLVAVAQDELADCLGVKQLRIFILDAAAYKLWHVGEHSSNDASPAVVRRYVSGQASLCSLVLHSDAAPIVLPQPAAEAAFNDTVDIPGGARGLYLVPILSPWGNGSLPFGVIQVSRVAKARLSASPFALTVSEGAGNATIADIVVNNEREAAQQTEDRLMLELLGLFCRVFAGLLHHVTAQQLYDTCPPEIMQAQLATLTDHLESLRKWKIEDEDNDNSPATPTVGMVTLHERTANSRQSGRHASIATVLSMTPPSHDVRRVASADPKHRATPEPRPVTSSTTSSYQPQAGDTAGVRDAGSYADFNKTDEAGTSLSATPDTVHVADDSMSANGDDAETGMLETASGDPELFAPDQEQEPVGNDGLTTWPEVYETADARAPTSNDWTDDTIYAAAQDQEQLAAQDDGGYHWGDSSAYDPTLWSARENGDTYAEDVGWTYGALDEETAANEDEDSSRQHREGSHISTNSTYAIDLHLSSRASTAGTDQPRGM